MTVYLITLSATICIECAIIMLIRWFSPSLREKPLGTTCASANLLTHPLATLAYTTFSFPFLPVELIVVAAEFIVYRFVAQVSWRWSVLIAVVTNTLSMSIGFFVI